VIWIQKEKILSYYIYIVVILRIIVTSERSVIANLMSLYSLVLLKILKMWALVPCEFKKDLGVWLFRLLSGTVYTGGKSPQDGLRYV